jgi:hypothetical protein
MYSTIANTVHGTVVIYGTVVLARSELLDLDQTVEREPNSQHCSYRHKYRGSKSHAMSVVGSTVLSFRVRAQRPCM